MNKLIGKYILAVNQTYKIVSYSKRGYIGLIWDDTLKYNLEPVSYSSSAVSHYLKTGVWKEVPRLLGMIRVGE